MSSKRIAIQGENGRMGLAIRENAQALDFQVVELKDSWDCLIDFSSSSGLMESIKICRERKKPLLSGTTGFDKVVWAAVESLAEDVPVLWASNFSVGITLMKRFLRDAAGPSGAFTFQLIETHHKHKKDAPSGTAQTLQEALPKDAPEPLSIRAGEVFGIHRIEMYGEGERLVIEHVAENRSVFAIGALRAARFLITRPMGLYSVEDWITSENSRED